MSTEALGQVGPYRLLQRIGEGAMGEVFVAEDRRRPGRRVALKRLLPALRSEPDFVNMWRDEVRLCGALAHPNIVPVLDAGIDGRDDYFVMEWVDGVDLAHLLGRLRAEGAPRLPEACAYHVVARVLEALAYAHDACDAQGAPLELVHRDVSPPNILLGYDGRVRLSDFGMARARGRIHQTDFGLVKGRLGYMAPESASLQRLDRRADVFSAAVVAYELLAGRHPVGDASMPTLVQRFEARAYPSLSECRPDIPAAVDFAVTRALSPKPDHRFRGAAAFLKAMREAVWIPSDEEGASSLQAFLGSVGVVGAGELAQLVPLPERAEAPELRTEVSAPHAPRFDADDERETLSGDGEDPDETAAEATPIVWLPNRGGAHARPEETAAAVVSRSDALGAEDTAPSPVAAAPSPEAPSMPVAEASAVRSPISDAVAVRSPISDAKAGRSPISDAKAGRSPISDAKAGRSSISDARAGRAPTPNAPDLVSSVVADRRLDSGRVTPELPEFRPTPARSSADAGAPDDGLASTWIRSGGPASTPSDASLPSTARPSEAGSARAAAAAPGAARAVASSGGRAIAPGARVRRRRWPFVAVALVSAVAVLAGAWTSTSLFWPRLRLVSDPPGAAITINDEPQAVVTPADVKVPPKAQRLELRFSLPGRAEALLVVAREFERARVYALPPVSLGPLPRTVVRSDVAVRVYLNGVAVGEGRELRLPALPPEGRVVVRLEADGRPPREFSFAGPGELPPELAVAMKAP